MARKLALLIALAFPSLLAAQERPPVDPLAGASPQPAQTPGATPRQPGAPQPGMRRPGSRFLGGPDGEKTRQALQQLTPEERQHFLQRLKEFSELSPEKKKEIFERTEYYRRKMREDVEAAVKESGLNLTDEQRKKFAERYFEERKKIEEELRRQMDEIRKPKLHELAQKLKTEFASQASEASPAPK